MLVAAVVLGSGVFLAARCASPAWADDPPPTTSVPVTTEPAPDPAPPKPKPAPKPQPKPKPRPASPAPRPASQPAPAYRPTSPPPAASPKPVAHPKAKKVHKKARPKKKITAPKPKKTTVTRSLSPLGVPATAQGAPSPGSGGTVFLLVVASLAMAIACFGVASIPATYLPRRGTADFVVRHKLHMTVLGVGLLIAAALTL